MAMTRADDATDDFIVGITNAPNVKSVKVVRCPDDDELVNPCEFWTNLDVTMDDGTVHNVRLEVIRFGVVTDDGKGVG